MKLVKIVTLFIVIAVGLLSTSCKNCKEWYTSVALSGVTRTENNNDDLGDWFDTNYLSGELNFRVAYYFTADDFDRCKTSERIHTILKDQMVLICSNPMYIGNDTIPANTNIINYFDRVLELKGNDFYVFDTINNEFPRFSETINNFKVEVPLSDGTKLEGTVFLSIN